MISLFALALLAQTVLAPGLYSVPACGPTATATPAPTPTATVAPTPTATPTSAIVIGPTPVPPLLAQFYTTMGADGKVHAFPYSIAWNVQVGVVGIAAMDVTIDGVLVGGAGKHTYIFPSGNLFGYFFWQNTVGTHLFLLTFYDSGGDVVGSVPEQITVYP